jgi:hypothetical protein
MGKREQRELKQKLDAMSDQEKQEIIERLEQKIRGELFHFYKLPQLSREVREILFFFRRGRFLTTSQL